MLLRSINLQLRASNLLLPKNEDKKYDHLRDNTFSGNEIKDEEYYKSRVFTYSCFPKGETGLGKSQQWHATVVIKTATTYCGAFWQCLGHVFEFVGCVSR